MKKYVGVWIGGLLMVMARLTAHGGEAPPIHHDIQVTVRPETHGVRFTDTIRIPAGRVGMEMVFLLNRGINVRVEGKVDSFPSPSGARPEDFSDAPREMVESLVAAGFRAHVVRPLAGTDGDLTLTVRGDGILEPPPPEAGFAYGGGHARSSGTLSVDGIHLDGSTGWIPWFGPAPVTFDLTATLPAGWQGLSSGERLEQGEKGGARVERWRAQRGVDEILLLAAPWREYAREGAKPALRVLLRTPDSGLAERFLDHSMEQIALFSKLYGAYPYPSFTVAENFQETGLGMPGFTLLGGKVMRLPFILTTSLPHEILHNWWGNGVLPDLNDGNWTEGFTAYLADHLMAERAGQGGQHRQGILKKYADYVREGKDFPLVAFRGGSTGSVQAAGYGRMAMFTHMLRRELGDEAFLKGVRAFYQENLSRRVGFKALQVALERASGRDLSPLFTQWTTREGAPVLDVAEAVSIPDFAEGGFKLRFTLSQVQGGEPFHVRVPLAIHLEGKEEAIWREVTLTTDRQEMELPLPGRPLRLEVDPEYDVFRRLGEAETPPALGRLFGDEIALLLLPSKASKPMQRAWRRLAAAWGLESRLDSEVTRLPKDRSVWLLGWENLHRGAFFESLGEREEALYETGMLNLEETHVPRQGHTVALAARHPLTPSLGMGLIFTEDGEAIYNLAGRLPHFGRFGFVAFRDADRGVVAKGDWRVKENPLDRVVVQLDAKPVSPLRARRPSRGVLGAEG